MHYWMKKAGKELRLPGIFIKITIDFSKTEIAFCSPLKALTIVWPENISSIWPFIFPKEF